MAPGNATGGNLDYTTLLNNQIARQAAALDYKEKSTEETTKFQLESANLKNKEAIASSVAATANAQSQTLARA